MASDTFTYSDGALPTQSSGAWITGQGTAISVVSGQTEGSLDEDGETAYYAGPWTDDQFSQATFHHTGTSYKGLTVRTSGSGGSYTAYQFISGGSSDNRIQKVVSASATDLVTGITGPATGSVMKMTVTGSSTTTIKVYDDTVEIASYDDSSSPIASGSPGILFYRLNTGTGFIDDWSGEDLGTPASGFGALVADTRNRLVVT